MDVYQRAGKLGRIVGAGSVHFNVGTLRLHRLPYTKGRRKFTARHTYTMSPHFPVLLLAVL